jgi:glucosamine 6-phosphate synthetase-like amidotransferase/phosphosugar isomerase protein
MVEAYPAGELKHGPIALIDKETPVIAVAPNDELLDKLKSNLQSMEKQPQTDTPPPPKAVVPKMWLT